jgi:hypothetical protein
MVKPYVNSDSMGRTIKKSIPGTIVYINWKHRFYVAEYDCPGGKIREAFKFCMRDDLACLLGEPIVEPSPKRTGEKKRVRCSTTGKIYPSIKEASRQTGIDVNMISRICWKERGPLDGMNFEFVWG